MILKHTILYNKAQLFSSVRQHLFMYIWLFILFWSFDHLKCSLILAVAVYMIYFESNFNLLESNMIEFE